jgi:glycosyltransferase involved in cell wall biosynthesis
MKMQGMFTSHIKHHLRRYRPYILFWNVKANLEKSLKDLYNPRNRVISLKPEKASRGNVLFSYFIEPFLNPEQADRHFFSNRWEALQIARTFLDLGYHVDVIDTLNSMFIPEKDYAIFVDNRFNLPRLAPLLNKHCVKIMYSDTAHILFHSTAEMSRLLALQHRKGVTLRPRRFERPNLAIEHADCAIALGNEFTINTFRYANKPIYRVPLSQPVLYPWPEEKDFEACRKRFLWIGSGGLVHKGLDLVLDALAEMPEYHLTICGPIPQEEDFESAYHKELYQTPNVRTVGWVDIYSPEFTNIINSCVGLIYPSCSEGGGQSAINCMHGGLIPIVSYESSVDVDSDFGIVLKNCSVEEIKNSMRAVSELPAEELKQMARKAWEFARANHTRERFAQEYRKVIVKILSDNARSIANSSPAQS